METVSRTVSAAFAVTTVTLEMFFSHVNFSFLPLRAIFSTSMITKELCLKKAIFPVKWRALSLLQAAL